MFRVEALRRELALIVSKTQDPELVQQQQGAFIVCRQVSPLLLPWSLAWRDLNHAISSNVAVAEGARQLLVHARTCLSYM